VCSALGLFLAYYSSTVVTIDIADLTQKAVVLWNIIVRVVFVATVTVNEPLLKRMILGATVQHITFPIFYALPAVTMRNQTPIHK
jgi:hypothetical protein